MYAIGEQHLGELEDQLAGDLQALVQRELGQGDFEQRCTGVRASDRDD
jgi:hypothetical protein